jgi:ribosomal protein L37AE/L43A
MSNLGCPKCNLTPVVYFPSSKKWVCKRCGHEWKKAESDGSEWEDKWGPRYVVNQEAIEQLKKKFIKNVQKKKSN